MTQTSLPYYQIQELSASLRGQTARYFSKPGIPHWNEVSPAERLLAVAADPPAGEPVLMVSDGPAALAACLALSLRDTPLILTGNNSISLDLAGRTIQSQKIGNVSVSYDIQVDPTQAESFASGLICLPKGRKLFRRWLMQCWQCLRPRGTLYLSGANQEGIQPAARDAEEVFGPGSILGYKKGNRIIRFLKPLQPGRLPDWAGEAGIPPGTWHHLDAQIAGKTLRLASLPGVFSYEQLDEGTAMLLEQLHIKVGERVVDVGCGYGAIGMAAALLGAGQVDLVDINLLAVAAANENIQHHNIPNAQAFAGDVLGWASDRTYDLVVSNPPFHNGHDVDYQVAQAFIQDSWRVLHPGGWLVLVANRFLRYDRLMETAFGQVSTLAESGKYHVLQSQRGR